MFPLGALLPVRVNENLFILLETCSLGITHKKKIGVILTLVSGFVSVLLKSIKNFGSAHCLHQEKV